MLSDTQSNLVISDDSARLCRILLGLLQDDLKRKEGQIAKLSAMEMSSDGVRAQYDRLVADLLKEQEALKTKHSELHKRLKEVDVWP